MSPLDCITERNLRRLANERWFARGEAYHNQARVADLTVEHNIISASVHGTDVYRVQLSCRNSRLTYNCTCPIGEDGNFCKHCVAVGLAWLNQPDKGISSKSTLQTFLENMDHQQLVQLALSAASNNRRLRDKLEFAEASAAGPNLSVFRKAITTATRTADIDYYSMPRFARRVLDVLQSLRTLLEAGHAKAVVELAEYAFTRLEKAIGHVDDSDGHFGDIIPELTELHHAACVLAREEPVALAQRLFEFELNSDWEFFYGASATYADVLGEKGLLEYRRLAEELWSKVPVLGPDDKGQDRYGTRFRITSMMETLARQSGDVQALITIKQRDLSHPYSFLQIAELYREVEQHDLALHWAKKGASSFESIDSRLSDFMATEYHRLGHHEKAMKLIWEQFVTRPGLEMYQHLHEHALQVKSPREKLRLVGKNDPTDRRHKNRGESTPKSNDEWERWRAEALRFLRERVEPSPAMPQTLNQEIPVSNPWRASGDHSVLVEVFLWEGNYEEAWEDAMAGGASAYLWLQLADLIAPQHPARAYLVYKELIAPTLAQTNNTAYSEAIKLLKKMYKLSSPLRCEPDFIDYLASLRVEYKRKRNFIQMLDKLLV